jgi:hypothetical protein
VGSVPVYFGAPNAADFAPRNSFINATEFNGPAALGAYLTRLLKEPSLFAKYHAWRTDTDEVNRLLMFAKVCVSSQERPFRRAARMLVLMCDSSQLIERCCGCRRS